MKRPRGRSQNNNMNRRGQNSLSRTYESNGPDIKVRGTASQVAEKYIQLWRDALAAGDMVAAENYLQHAEHYNRIVASFVSQHNTQPVSYNKDDERAEGSESSENEEGGVDVPETGHVSRYERSEAQGGRFAHNGGEYTPRENRTDNRGSRENPRYSRDREPRQEYGYRQNREPRAPRDEPQSNEDVSSNVQPREQRVHEPRQDNRQRYSRDNRDNNENRQPRQRLPRPRYNNQSDDGDVGELPSFITGGSALSSSAAAPVSNDDVAIKPVTPLSVAPDFSDEAPAVEKKTVAAAPRRRTTRTRPVEAEEGVSEEKPAPRRRAAVRKENIEAE